MLLEKIREINSNPYRLANSYPYVSQDIQIYIFSKDNLKSSRTCTVNRCDGSYFIHSRQLNHSKSKQSKITRNN